MSQPANIVIIGGGIIGCSTAYFLTRSKNYDPSKTKITLIEASSIAAGASGKAGGLLALDWHGEATASLAGLSFRLHCDLAAEHSGLERWGYRQLTTVEAVCEVGRKKKDGRPSNVPDWVNEGVCMKSSVLGTPSTTAQVHPERFTKAMSEMAAASSVRIVLGSATKINIEKDIVTSVTYTPQNETESQILSADTVIVAAGPWTTTILPQIPISATRAHSITIKTPTPISAHALFTTIRSSTGSMSRPEIYARPDEAYVCGEGDETVSLPDLAKDVAVDISRCKELLKHVSEISSTLANRKVDRQQACYLPLYEAGPGPAIGWVEGMKGVCVAAGHSCWGISNGPGTGKVMSELVLEGGVISADVSQLQPTLQDALNYSTLHSSY